MSEERGPGKHWGRWIALFIGVILAIAFLLVFEVIETAWLTGLFNR